MVWGVFDWGDEAPQKSEEGSEADYPECDYDSNLTPLYEAIEERAWIAVNQFLHSGYWPESLFADSMTPEEQARTWVTRYETRPDGSKKVRWSQLPIHAAVIFGAPSVVIQQLVEAFPQSVRCTDDHRMLPLHLAFRHGSDDSVLALFLEEFPEAVNVRGYKGRLPVECAQKGPNPERGAIIQTILHKNQSVWERKKSAVQLKELYCIKEALKIKSQKVSHLETAIREIKSREHKTRKELAATMTELKAAKIKTTVDDENMSNADKSAERQAVKQLVEKLAALEMATKDLVDKEKSTKKELRKTLAELEAAKGMKPSDDQVEQFTKLEKVASHEEGDKLARKGGDEESAVDSGEDKDLAIKVYSIKADATASLKPGTVSSRKTEKSTRTPVKKSEEKKKKEDKKRAAEKKSAEGKKGDANLFQKAEAMLAKRGEKAAIKKAEKAVFGEEESTTIKSKSTAKSRSSDKTPYLKTSTSREEERKKLRKVEERNVALVLKIAELEAAKNEQEELRKVEDRRSELKKAEQKIATKMEKEAAKQEADATKEQLRKAAATNEALEKKIATLSTNEALERKIAALESTMKDYEDKQMKAQEEFDVVSMANKQNGQTEQMIALQFELRELQENSNKTKQELEAALKQLNELRTEQEARAAAALMEKSERNKEAEEKNKNLEKKVALLELALKQFEEKSTVARTEMNNIKDTIMQDTDVKLTAAQQRYMNRLEESMKKLEKNAKKTKKELDNALAELDAMKAKEAENAQLLAAVEKEKFRSVEQTNKALEEKIRILEYTMKCFEEKAAQTKQEMDKAMEDLKKSDESTVASGESMKLTKRQKKHMLALENAMKKLEDRAVGTKDELDKALTELRDLKQAEEVAYVKNEAQQKKENKALKDLSKKVQALQTAMVGFEVKETRTMQELEKAMQELEDVSNKRFEVLSMAAEKAEELATDNAFTKEVVKLEKRASQEEKRLEELEKAVQEVITKSGTTKDELERTQSLLHEIKTKEEARDPPLTKAEKEEVKNDKKLVKDLTKKVATLQSAVIGFEVKETRTMKELEHTMKQLEELTSKRFEVLEQAASLKEKDTERLAAAGALAEEKVAALHTAMKELEESATKTHQELEATKVELEAMKKANEEGVGMHVLANQDGQIKDLNEKITVLQQAVMGFEVKETKTMQELEQTMKQLEELTAKRFEVLQKVAGREIEAAKAAEADKYTKKAAAEEKKVAALEFAMRELESKAYKTKLELERTMKGLEHLEEKQEESQKELSGVTIEEKRVMRELVNKVADIQDAVMAYDEKEHKTSQELEKTKKELEATKREVEMLREKQGSDIHIMPTEDAQSEMEAVEVNEGVDVQSVEGKEATETAKRVTEETLTSLETAIHRLVERLGNDEDPDGTSLLAERIASEFGKDTRIATAMDELKEAYSKEMPTTEHVKDLVPTTSERQQPVASQEPEVKKRRSFFGSKSSSSSTRPPKSPKVPKKQQQEKKKRFSFFGSKRNNKSEPKPTATPAPASKTTFVSTPTAATPPPAPATAPPVVTAEQRKAVEEVHGTQITALLTDQQVLDLLNKMPTGTDSGSLLTNEINIASTKSGEGQSLDKGTVGGQSASLQSASLPSGPTGSGMKQQDPHMMIVSLPSQRVGTAQPAPAISASPSMRSQRSARSSHQSEKTVPTSPRSPRSRGSVSPAPLSPSGSGKMMGATSPRSPGSAKSGKSRGSAKKNNSMTTQDVLVANGTYDDGFEINF